MKKILTLFTLFLIVLFIGFLSIPYFFKDEIKNAIDKELATSIEADVVFDLDNFNISVLRNFPNITVGVEELAVIGRGVFKENILFSAQNFELEVNLKQLLFDEKINVESILLDQPIIGVKILSSGKTNYDIIIPKKEITKNIEKQKTSSPLNISIKKWEIKGGNITYTDETTPFTLQIKDLNHIGTGNFSLDIFDIITKTNAIITKVSYKGITYINNRRLTADIGLEADLNKMKFKFKDNEIKLNDFKVGVSGWVAMPSEDYDMDLSISSTNNSFKSIISLIPAIYTSGYDAIKARGTMNFGAKIKGTYTDKKKPAFNIALGIKDGYFQYPNFPSSVSNVQIKMLIDNKDGNIDNTKIDVEHCHIELSKNPIDLTLKIANLVNFPIDLNLSAKLRIADIFQTFPVGKNIEAKGNLKANLQAKGLYDSLTSTIPLSGNFLVTDFYYSDKEILSQVIDIPLTKISFNPKHISLDAFKAKIGKSDFFATGKITNYINHIFMPNEILSGHLSLTSNKVVVDELILLSDTTKKQTEKTTTAIDYELYNSINVPKNIDFIADASIGEIEYNGFIMTKTKGIFSIKDNILNIKNLNTNTPLGGKVIFNANYNTQNPKDPKFDTNFGIKNVSIMKIFTFFNPIQRLAPIAQHMKGNITTDFFIDGHLDSTMKPIYKTVSGNGVLKIKQATLTKGKFVSLFNKVISKNIKSEMVLEDINMKIIISNGVVNTPPFHIFIDGNKSTISGRTGLDGALDYKIHTSIPMGELGQQVSSTLNNLLGNKKEPKTEIKLNLGITGFYNNPKVTILSLDSESEIKKQLTKVALSKAIKQVKKNRNIDIPISKKEIEKKLEEEKAKKDVIIKAHKDSIKRILTEKEVELKKKMKEEEAKLKKQLENEVKDKINSIFNKKDN